MFKTTAMVHLTNRRQALASLQRAETRGFYTKIAILATLSLGLVSFIGTSTPETSLHRQLPEANRWKIEKPRGLSHDEYEKDQHFNTKTKTRYLFIQNQDTIQWSQKEDGQAQKKSGIEFSEITEMKQQTQENTVLIKGEEKWHQFIFDDKTGYNSFVKIISSKFLASARENQEKSERKSEAKREIIAAASSEHRIKLMKAILQQATQNINDKELSNRAPGCFMRANNNINRLFYAMENRVVVHALESINFDKYILTILDDVKEQIESWNFQNWDDDVLEHETADFKQMLDDATGVSRRTTLAAVRNKKQMGVIMLEAAQKVIRKLTTNIEKMPYSFRQVTKLVDSQSSKLFKGHKDQREDNHKGSYVFLRVLCPYISLLYKRHGLDDDRYFFKELGKVIQQAANDADNIGENNEYFKKAVGFTALEFNTKEYSNALIKGVEESTDNEFEYEHLAEMAENELKESTIKQIIESVHAHDDKHRVVRQVETPGKVDGENSKIYIYNFEGKFTVVDEGKGIEEVKFTSFKLLNDNEKNTKGMEEALNNIVAEYAIEEDLFEYQYEALDEGESVLIISTEALNLQINDEAVGRRRLVERLTNAQL